MTPPIHCTEYFCDQAAAYQAFRPVYPPTLVAFLASRSPGRSLAWDCGCGSGQFTAGLAGWFDNVVGTDASFPQLRQAPANTRITYIESLAEAAPLADQSVDLVVAAQALHWFRLEPFYAEVRRVVRKGGLIGAISYGLLEITPSIDRIIRRLHTDVVGEYWPPERKHVDTGYSELAFPFEEVETPAMTMKDHWTLGRLLGYLGTWSAVRRYVKANGSDPLDLIKKEMEMVWGDLNSKRTIRWPLTVRAGRVE